MKTPPPSSEDLNAHILHRMAAGGDDLSQPRKIDFCFIFPERRQALAFAALVDNPRLEVCLSFYQGRDCWQAIVRRHMIPALAEINELESSLAAQAESVGGQADGWGCFSIKAGSA